MKKCGIVNCGRPLFGPTRSGARQPVRIGDDVDKKLDQSDRRLNSANFPLPMGSRPRAAFRLVYNEN